MVASRRGWPVAILVVAGCGFQISPSTGDGGTPDGGRDGGGPAAPCELALGSDHTCVRRRADGSVWCFGQDGSGQLGIPTGTTSMATQVDLGMRARSAASRFFHTCAALDDGTARCWGQNDNQQIGDGTSTNQNLPIQVVGLTAAVEIAVARSFSCARRTDASISCWGAGTSGALGDGSFTSQATPVSTVIGLPTTPVRLALGAGHGCALLADKTGWCWGANVYGQLGDGTTTDRNQPVAMPVSGLAQIAAGGYSVGGGIAGAQTCGLKTDRTVWCWGSNEFGQLGNDTTAASLAPVQVAGLTDAVELVMGRFHVCARRAAGEVVCWGRNESGEIGDGTTTDRARPTPVVLPGPAVQIDGGGYHTCALLADGGLSCWGKNGSRQLGDGGTSDQPTPVMSAPVCQ